ncbi:MAG: RNA polymerase sigma-70 factor [Cyclobacteriaceae bacterium]
MVKQNNRDAFKEIYNKYWQNLYRYGIQIIHCSHDVEDIIQELFVSFWINRKNLEIKSSLSGYFFKALKYKIINYIEHNLVKKNYLYSLNCKVLEYEDEGGLLMEAKELEKWMNIGVNGLSPKVQQVFELSRKDNLSIREIALKLKVSDQTVKNQISKALKDLKIHLTKLPA